MCFKLFKRNKTDLNNLKLFKFRYIKGWYANGDISFKLEKTDAGYVAYIKPLLVPVEDTQSFAVDQGFAAALADILKNAGVVKWDGFKKADKRVQDGKHFDLYIRDDKGNSVDASGYEKWPRGYKEVKAAVGALFKTLAKDARLD